MFSLNSFVCLLDLALPAIDGSLVFDDEKRKDLREALGRSSDAIATWITPEVARGFYKEIVWLRPSWMERSPLEDGRRKLIVGDYSFHFLSLAARDRILSLIQTIIQTIIHNRRG